MALVQCLLLNTFIHEVLGLNPNAVLCELWFQYGRKYMKRYPEGLMLKREVLLINLRGLG